MKLKALLLGSAAALIAVSGAHAADAVVAEPEPMDYVKVCDMYGAGFFYIPGTETCLRIAGYAQVEYDYSDYSNGGTSTLAGSTQSGAQVEGRVTFLAQSETDYGTLASFLRLDGSESQVSGANVSTAVDVSNTWISLGNLSMGHREHRAALAALPGGPFDGNDQNLGDAYYIDYTFAANGMSATFGGGATENTPDIGNVYLRLDYAGSMYNLAASITHVGHVGVASPGNGDSEQYYNIWGNITPIEGLTIQGYYNDSSINNSQRWGIGASFAVTDSVSVAGGYFDAQRLEKGYFGQVSWAVTPGLAVTVAAEEKEILGTDETSFRLRVKRSF
ncbi:MAG: porin [Rhizobiaceae bacterium]